MDEIINYFKINKREDAIKFLNSLWLGEPQICPLCSGSLEHFHKKAKKSNTDWICSKCKKKFETIKILDELNK